MIFKNVGLVLNVNNVICIDFMCYFVVEYVQFFIVRQYYIKKIYVYNKENNYNCIWRNLFYWNDKYFLYVI